jgi:hypothetical protein
MAIVIIITATPPHRQQLLCSPDLSTATTQKGGAHHEDCMGQGARVEVAANGGADGLEQCPCHDA